MSHWTIIDLVLKVTQAIVMVLEGKWNVLAQTFWT
jgi:hypothetical protein